MSSFSLSIPQVLHSSTEGFQQSCCRQSCFWDLDEEVHHGMAKLVYHSHFLYYNNIQ